MGRSIHAPTPELNKINKVVDIVEGGTAGSTAIDAVTNIGGLSTNNIDQPGGLLGLDNNGHITSGQLSGQPGSIIALVGNKTVTGQSTNTYFINNYDAGLTYNVSVDIGTVSIVKDTITFIAPSTSGIANLTINSSVFDITVEVNGGGGGGNAISLPPTVLKTPAILSPTGPAVDVGMYLNVISDPLDAVGGTELAKFLPNQSGLQWFGNDVAISGDGLTVAVGSPLAGALAGKLYVYKYDGATWVETILPPTDAAIPEQKYGYATTVNFDGSIVFSVKLGSNSINAINGKMYVHKYDGTSWTSDVVLSGENGGNYGNSISCSSDGLTVVVGAPGTLGENAQGYIHIYKFDGVSWVKTKIFATDGAVGNKFGWSVSMSSDGLTVVVGAYRDNTVNGGASGSVYTYKYDGTDWIETKIVAFDGAASDMFGQTVSVNSDGSAVVVGTAANTVNGNYSGSVYVINFTNNTVTQNKLLASDGAASDYFGQSVSISDDGLTIVVGAYGDDTTNGSNSGSVYMFNYNGTDWIETNLLANDGATGDQFGNSISISSVGLALVVGAVFDGGDQSGSAYIFKPVYHLSTQYQVASDASFTNIVQDEIVPGTTNHDITGLVTSTTYYVRLRYTSVNNGTTSWSNIVEFTTANAFVPNNELAKISASDGAANDQFGNSVSISDDGLTVVAGSHFNDNTNGSNSGSTYIYEYNGTNWLETKLTASDGAANDQFGNSVSISGDGLTVVVGAYGDDTTNGSNSGSVYIYKYDGTNWVETKLLASDGVGNEQFGYSVSVSSDGLRVNVVCGQTRGLYIYDFNGATWVETKITVDASINAIFATGMSSNGNNIIIGTPYDVVNGADSGSAYIYKYNGTSWVETKLLASDGAAGDFFGRSVAISSDGLTVVVGSISDANGSNSGSTYIYEYNGTNWLETKLTASDGAANDQFGNSVSISGDGLTIVVGAYLDANANGASSGSVYVHKYDGTNWVETKLLASDGVGNEQFGYSATIGSSGLNMVVGAIYGTTNGTNRGSTYIFGM